METIAIEGQHATPCPLTAPHQALWVAAIREYWRDALAYDRTGRSRDKGEAFTDLHTDRELLSNLCGPLGLSVDWVSKIILSAT
jgi:hypothetical protein